MRRELGLHGGRPLWRTRVGRVLLFIALVLALDSIHFAWRASLWDTIILTDINSAVVAARRVETRGLIFFTWLCGWLSAAAFLFPLWMCARAWSHLDRDPGWDQIRLTGVRPAEMIWGKTVSWFGVWVGTLCLSAFLAAVSIRDPLHSQNPRSLLDFMLTSESWEAGLLQDDLMPTTLLWCQVQHHLSLGGEIYRFGWTLLCGVALFILASMLAIRWGAVASIGLVAAGGVFPLIGALAHGDPMPFQLRELFQGGSWSGWIRIWMYSLAGVTLLGLPAGLPLLVRRSRRLCGPRP